MAQAEVNPTAEKTKQVTAQDVYQLTSETLQEIFSWIGRTVCMKHRTSGIYWWRQRSNG